MRFRFFIVIAIFFIIAPNLFAQDYLMNLTYNMAQPLGNTKEFVDEFSFRGLGFEGRNFSKKNFSFGFNFGWNIIDHQTNETVQLENGAISGRQVRYINSFPFHLTGHYYLGGRRDPVRFFGGLGIGTYYIIQRFELGVTAIENDRWHFGLAPEIGILVPAGDIMLIASIKYNHAFDSGKTVFGDDDNTQSYIGFNVGIGFVQW